ncbi:hypothetical protein [Thalassoroseus pseudoceratinae]|uniref:hypothetical protein n=1 Tax=Thalassoroseus pseudoceratinae TaxID=2713176 RepID=UPI00141E6121|nr:hypothetical protein [Thalassoroseus pseudoceratinae]
MSSESVDGHRKELSGAFDRWDVWRQDDNGNQFLVSSNLPHDAAQQQADELESHGHKQLYWIAPGRRDTA